MGVLKVPAAPGVWRKVGCGPQVFTFTGADQSFVVPAGVTSLLVDLYGAEGGTGTFVVTPAGKGGRVRTAIAVTPGETLTVKVGEIPTSATGGWPNGGAALASSNGSRGGAGAGATSIWRGATLLAIAGGGGGSGGGESDEVAGAGGDGGGTTGANGTAGDTVGTAPGHGGTSAAGGAAGTNGTTDGSGGPSSAPTAGASNAGGTGGLYSGWYSGGGGGGGYFGGGGGGAAASGFISGPNAGPPHFFPLTTASGGGGGSSHTSGSVLVNDQGIWTGHGQLLIEVPGHLRLELPDETWIREACDGDTGRHPLKIEDPAHPGSWITVACMVPV